MIPIVRRDVFDPLVGIARSAAGHTQWMTAGQVMIHSERFPLLDAAAANPVEAFQVWLSLPANCKLAEPTIRTMRAQDIPLPVFEGFDLQTEVLCIAWSPLPDGIRPLAPPPMETHDSTVSSSIVKVFPLARDSCSRVSILADLSGSKLTFADIYIIQIAMSASGSAAYGSEVQSQMDVRLKSKAVPVEFFVLQGSPIYEPVYSDTPIVMNSTEKVRQAYADFQKTRLSGWLWPVNGPVRGAEMRRFSTC